MHLNDGLVEIFTCWFMKKVEGFAPSLRIIIFITMNVFKKSKKSKNLSSSHQDV